LVLGSAIQDVTTDGWVLNKLHVDNVKYAGPIQSLGIKCGMLFGFAIFTELEKLELMTLPNWFLTVAILIGISTIFILLFVPEVRQDKSEAETETYDQVSNKSDPVVADSRHTTADTTADPTSHLTPFQVLKAICGALFRKRNILLYRNCTEI